ncbi:MAG: hypothetical protein DRH50_15225 [Deltaproteobacteria bacterium]|nr:MAG: hypothetical protein DRH50_15225 [Deltaproteobacteria bacterium]
MYEGLLIKTPANPPDIVCHFLQTLSAESDTPKKWRTSSADFGHLALDRCFPCAAEISRTQEVLRKREALSLTPPDKTRAKKTVGKKQDAKNTRRKRK